MKLLEPLQFGKRILKNRVFMAPLVRARSDSGRAPTDIVGTYYAQRASAGLIITEGTHVSPWSATRTHASGQHTDAQTAAWGRVVTSVHQAGGTIFQQLYHVGRRALRSALPNNGLPLAPSPIRSIDGILTDGELEPFPLPRALETHEVAGIVDDFRFASRRAAQAGFDGVEIMGGGGFLIDQFLRDGSNVRTDAYGGSLENRARLLLEVVDAAIAELGAAGVGIRLAPHFRADGISDTDILGAFTYVVKELERRGIAYIHLLEGTTHDENPFIPLYKRIVHKRAAGVGPGPLPGDPFYAPITRSLFSGVLILNGGYSRESAEQVLSDGLADAVAFGRLYISNPDLPERFRLNAPLVDADTSTYFTNGSRGYTDYPSLAEQQSAETL
ncbi:alkene reductase [Pseudomonas ogarae]|uniref:alkene reductase n=1 Tax=Pseudomonas ogarae (strain DSM 112162 / CECT 30235 / F113) TaxID=1114970 RepID=UPI0009A31E3D|nr:alkene reductase [Pseudomonas ogarae]OPG72152.1 alkene reductase [Pseudomonas ogarae]